MSNKRIEKKKLDRLYFPKYWQFKQVRDLHLLSTSFLYLAPMWVKDHLTYWGNKKLKHEDSITLPNGTTINVCRRSPVEIMQHNIIRRNKDKYGARLILNEFHKYQYELYKHHKKNFVRVFTIQSSEVIDTLIRNKRNYNYHASLDRVSENLKAPYMEMSKQYKWNNEVPIFGCEDGTFGIFTGAKINDKSYVIELMVPKEYVRRQDYYNWTDMCYFMENPDEWSDSSEAMEMSFEQFIRDTISGANIRTDLCPDTDIPIQVTIPFIKRDWIIDYYHISKFIKNPDNYNKTLLVSDIADIINKKRNTRE